MATLGNERKLAVLNKENYEEHRRRNMARDTIVPRTQGDYITQVSEESEGRVTKKLSKEFSETESSILGALSRLDECLLNLLFQGHSRSAWETSRSTYGQDQGTNEDCSQTDLHPEARVSQSQSTQIFGPDDTYDRKRANIGLENQVNTSLFTIFQISSAIEQFYSRLR